MLRSPLLLLLVVGLFPILDINDRYGAAPITVIDGAIDTNGRDVTRASPSPTQPPPSLFARAILLPVMTLHVPEIGALG